MRDKRQKQKTSMPMLLLLLLLMLLLLLLLYVVNELTSRRYSLWSVHGQLGIDLTVAAICNSFIKIPFDQVIC